MNDDNNQRHSGRVIFYDKNKGFGRIEHPDFGEVFLHQSKMEEGFKVAHKNDLLSFEVVPSSRKRGVYEAMNVKFILNENLDVLKDSLANKVTIQGKVLNMNAGGLLMDVLGIEVFLPKSEVDVYEFNSYSIFLGKVLDIRVIGIDERSIIASRKVVLEEEESSSKRIDHSVGGINKIAS